MAEPIYQIITGSKKISELVAISSIPALSQSVIPVVIGSGLDGLGRIENGTTSQITYQNFRKSVIEDNPNIFTQAQVVQIGSGNSQQRTSLVGFEFTMITGSGIGDVTSVAEGVKLEVFGQGANAGVKFFSFDNTDATPANRFKTFMELGTGNGNLNLTRNVLATGNVNVAGNLGLGGNLNINQNLVVGGTITAQSYNTEFINETIIYDSGSTKFGDTIDDTHERTGSLLVSGSSSVIGNSYVSGEIQNTLLGAVTTSLINQNTSQGLVNNLTQAVTSSLLTTISGVQAYTASLKGEAIVSQSQQILNYNIFATTGSNNFVGNQRITGSLSISNGQFNVITGSGQLTSSLTFTHNITAPNDGNAILELRHNNDLYNDDIAIKLKADFAGAYIDYEEDGTPYSVLSVQSFANKNVYIHQDTRLLFSNLTVDDNLIVKQNSQLTGSLIVSGGITGSILATNGVVSSSNQLFELNNQTGSQNSINLGISIVTASLNAFTASAGTSTTNINSFTASQLAVNTLTQAVTSSLITIVGGLQAYTASLKSVAIVSSSNQLFELNNQTGSQNSINTLTQAVTSSLITIVGGLQAYTASLKGVGIVSSSNQLFELNNQTGSQNSINTLTQAVTSSLITIVGELQAYTASLKSVGIVSSSNQLFELNNQTGSQNSVNNLTLAVTSSLLTTISGVQSYTASLKGAAIVSSSQQIQNYNIFAVTASNNIFYGESSFTNKVTHTNGYIVLTQVSQSLNFADDTAAAAGGVPLGGLYRNGNFIAIRID